VETQGSGIVEKAGEIQNQKRYFPFSRTKRMRTIWNISSCGNPNPNSVLL